MSLHDNQITRHKISLALSPGRDNHPLAATAKMAILIVALQFLAVRSLFMPIPPPPLWAGRIYLWSKSQRIQIVIGGYGRSPTPSSMKKNSLMGRFGS